MIRLIFFYIIDYIHQLLLNIACVFSIRKIRVLMYHNITNEYIITNKSCLCRIDTFKAIIESYISNGYEFISVNEIDDVCMLKGKVKKAIVTFDDVPQNVYINALPFLHKLNIPYTLFVSTKYINSEGYISEKQLVELDKNKLCTIGAHSLTHCMLRRSNSLDDEIGGNKKYLEELLSHPILYFAYPYGRHSSVNKKVKKVVRKYGFKYAFGTIDSDIQFRVLFDRFYLPRRVVNKI